MQHLHTERLAAFDHEPLSASERAHLVLCSRCRNARDAYAQMVLRARALRDAELPAAARLSTWESIAAELRAEGMLKGAAVAAAPRAESPLRRSRGVSWHRVAWRMAAAMCLMLGGAVVGRVTAGVERVGVPLEGAESAASVVPSVSAVEWQPAESFTSVSTATLALERAQQEYERASLWLASNDFGARDSDVYRARLAALDQMMAASRAGLQDAPQDPVLNHYFLTASTAREATLQQLSGALPVDKTIERY